MVVSFAFFAMVALAADVARSVSPRVLLNILEIK
jgi:hypothetical protein